MANSSGFFNRGGGMSATYFYFWGGYIGTIIAAIVMGKIIKYVFSKDSYLCNILKLTITVYTIRWFVYYPIAFFRTALFITILCYTIFEIIKKRRVK